MNLPQSPTNLNLETLFPFELDDFQKDAIAALDAGQSVVVCAPTGSGKTLIGEYAIHRALAQGQRVFYTTPLKALSNQKLRDFQQKFGEELVGLITGDILINVKAPVVVMTTEIFRNMLYETPIGQVGTSVRDIGAVILDECHYLSDRQRGTVWEESIIYCPTQIQLVALSATIGNPQELTDWISSVRASAQQEETEENDCTLINSDFRPVPLRFYFSTVKGLVPLLNGKQTQINPKLKAKHPHKRRRRRMEDCPSIPLVISQLQERDMLPAIYLIFSRRGCDRAVDILSEKTLVNPNEARRIQQRIDEFIQQHPEASKNGQFEPLTRGIASHHAGLLPDWKSLVEELFEAGLVKVVFATATLAAGINMPARTTVLSALSKRSDDGHRLLTPSEFLQISGRAGRRGMDTIGHVVTVQTPFEGAKEAAYLATATPEPLRSWFTPSYGMVLNLLQKHTIKEAKDLLERSFAEYLAQRKLAPEQQAIASLTTDIAKLNIELAPINPKQFTDYEKLSERLKEERRLVKVLQQQAEATQKVEIAKTLTDIAPGQIFYLKGKQIPVQEPLPALLFEKAPGKGQSPYLICLGANNRWYVSASNNVVGIADISFPESALSSLVPPTGLTLKQGQTRKGDAASVPIAQQIRDRVQPLTPAPEVLEYQERVERLTAKLENHPLHQWGNSKNLLKRYKKRLALREQLKQSQSKYQRHQLNRSYYWQDFLNLIEILREFGALDEFVPTPLGEATAAIRSENELWLSLILLSGELETLAPHQLAATLCAAITETPRQDSWSNFAPSQESLEVLDKLQNTRRRLNQVQHQHNVALPVWLERRLMGVVEQWALGEAFSVDWNQLCDETSLDDGDIVRMLRRTVDVLLQLPQIPGISEILQINARLAATQMRRFPV
ncbi:DEAD/DEAH box helicase [Lusitaniella coriacea LEGE 07157]|uniref:DEAD/DEAH box helicase n=1 Tax=Lusitaniella coriacea LEGE 07157 TaxID=945747 RepID=A0A8J7AYV5_9CYAN|nr:DEAD/DEAH box helicase [Lusitaniella coriacea LEGE 07157]